MGDGSNIKIQETKWLFRPSTNPVQSPVRILDKDARVQELIDEDTR